MHELNRADQVYVCLWSHADWEPGHIHFVIQPAWREQAASFPYPGARLQSEMLMANIAPEPARVEAFCEEARQWFAQFHAPEGPG